MRRVLDDKQSDQVLNYDFDISNQFVFIAYNSLSAVKFDKSMEARLLFHWSKLIKWLNLNDQKWLSLTQKLRKKVFEF